MNESEQTRTIYLYYSQEVVDNRMQPYFLGSVPAGECAKDAIFSPALAEESDGARDYIRYTHSSFSKDEYPPNQLIWQGAEREFRSEGVFGVWQDDYQKGLPASSPIAPVMQSSASLASGSESQMPVSRRHVLPDSDSLDLVDVFCAAARAQEGDVVVIPPSKPELKVHAERKSARYGAEGISFELGDA